MRKALSIMLLAAVIFYGCPKKPAQQQQVYQNPAPPAITYTIVKTYPHDTTSFTEGLFLLNNKLYESTGPKGESTLRINNLNTGKAEKEIHFDDEYFCEGISVLHNKLFQLTYQEQKVFVYDPVTLTKTNEFKWTTGEGWGMARNDSELIISNGTSNLYFIDPETFKIKRITGVTDEYGPVAQINELEYVNGVVYANIWETNTIIKIDPVTGKVLGRLDFTGLLEQAGYNYPEQWVEAGNVLNGIAYDAAKNTFYITGKRWPLIFEVRLN